MKPALCALLLGTGSLFAATPPSLRFADNLPRLPTLSLSDATKQSLGQPVVTAGNPVAAVRANPAKAPERRLFSAMPVVPPAVVDRRMPIVAPKEGIDYSMVVKEPAVDPSP